MQVKAQLSFKAIARLLYLVINNKFKDENLKKDIARFKPMKKVIQLHILTNIRMKLQANEPIRAINRQRSVFLLWMKAKAMLKA